MAVQASNAYITLKLSGSPDNFSFCVIAHIQAFISVMIKQLVRILTDFTKTVKQNKYIKSANMKSKYLAVHYKIFKTLIDIKICFPFVF